MEGKTNETGVELTEELQRALGDRYQIEREIGRGGMATVYLAREKHPHRLVAIKVLDPDVTTRLTRRRFLREIEVVSNLTHPHIVPIFAAGDEGGLLYYVMPYIDGETLRQRMSHAPRMTLEEILHIARDVADALDHAHANGVIHRDVKPENILLSGGHAVVADFGVARAMVCAECGEEYQPLTQAGLPIGTPLYMSPEQAAGRVELDGRADIYSLGCVLYEMLTGEAPYTGNTMYEIMAAHSQDPVPSIRTPDLPVPRHLRRAVMRSMSKDPSDRYDTASEFAAVLTTGSGSGEHFAPLSGSGRRAVAIGLAVLLLVALAVAAVRIFMDDRAATGLDEGRVVVARFENHTGDPSLDPLGAMAADWITRGLAETELVEIVEQRTGFAGPAGSSGASAAGLPASLGRETGAGIVVSGAYYRQDSIVRFQPRLTNARTGSVFAAVEPSVGSLADPGQGLEDLRQRVTAALVVKLNPSLRSSASLTTMPGYDAYREFMNALESWRGRNFEDAVRGFRRARQLDSTFSAPLLWEAHTYLQAGKFAAADSLVRHMSETNLTRFERHILNHIRASLSGDVRIAYLEMSQAAELAPRSEADFAAAMLALDLNRPRETIRRLSAMDPERGYLREWPWYWGTLGAAYHRLQLLDSELAATERGMRAHPESRRTHWYRMKALIAAGRTGEATALARGLASLPEQTDWSVGMILDSAVVELRAHGHDRAADEMTTLLELHYEREAADDPDRIYGLARARYHAGRYSEARDLLASPTAERPTLSGAGLLGVLHARLGDEAAAREAARLAAELGEPYQRGEYLFQQARIAAALGERQSAVSLLRRATVNGMTGFSRLAHDSELLSLRAATDFIEIVRPRD